MPDIVLGEKFSSFESLKDAIDRYQRDNNVQLIVKDSKLLGRIAKTMPKLMDVVNKEIIYYRLSYACEYHGEYKSKGNKVKSNHVSKRRGCPMRILLRLGEDLHHLVVYELFEQHNHVLEARDDVRTPKSQLFRMTSPKSQMFRMARVNTSRYMLTKMEQGENGQMIDVESSMGNEMFEEEEDNLEAGSSKTSSGNPPRLIGNATKRLLTSNDLRSETSIEDLKRRKLILQNRKLELEAKKLELENKKLEIEIKHLEKKPDEPGEVTVGGNTYYVSHVIEDSKEGITQITDSGNSFSTSAAEVIKSLTGRGQPIQIITQ